MFLKRFPRKSRARYSIRISTVGPASAGSAREAREDFKPNPKAHALEFDERQLAAGSAEEKSRRLVVSKYHHDAKQGRFRRSPSRASNLVGYSGLAMFLRRSSLIDACRHPDASSRDRTFQVLVRSGPSFN
jgi:hypothetical protein